MDDHDESGVYNVSPESIILHPDWNPYSNTYDADIAVLIVQNDVPLTTFIQPICIGSSDLGFKKGFITGWGKSEDETKRHENKPKELEIPIWTNEHCFLESNEFVKIASKRTFCAGSRDGRGACSGNVQSNFSVFSHFQYFFKVIVDRVFSLKSTAYSSSKVLFPRL